MSKASLLASATSTFAHLVRGASAKAAKADKPEDKDPEEPGAEEGGDDEMTDDEKRKKRNRDAGRDEDDDGDDGDADGKKSKKVKKAKAAKAEGDDSSDADDEGDADTKAIRMRENARCAAIFADPAAASRPDIAAQLAFGTRMPRSAAVDLLRAVADGERPAAAEGVRGIDARMSRVPQPDLGDDAPGAAKPDKTTATADAILLAGKRRRGEAA